MLIRQLHPDPGVEVESRDVYARPAGDRWLRVNMVASVDGAAAIGGRVGRLSGAADQELLHELRACCDVLLAGAGTIRAEGYGPLRLSHDEQRRRSETGQTPVPRLAVLSRSLDLDLTAPVFSDATARPLLVTAARAPVDRRSTAEEVADVLVAGEDRVDLGPALDQLAGVGLSHVLSEGGPHVLAELFAADLVDELCLAVAPLVTGGTDLRITAGPPLTPQARLRLHAVYERDEFLFLRYQRSGLSTT
jgi:riboflavin biosynthesis pyrimidine reductase